MNTPHLLADLGAALGLRDPQLDETDTCAFVLDDGLQVDLHFALDHDALCLCLEVGEVQPRQRPAALRQLLQANLTRTDLGHGHLALDESGDLITLCHTLPLAGQSATSVMAHISRLAGSCRQWRERLPRVN